MDNMMGKLTFEQWVLLENLKSNYFKVVEERSNVSYFARENSKTHSLMADHAYKKMKDMLESEIKVANLLGLKVNKDLLLKNIDKNPNKIWNEAVKDVFK